eukprot:281453-Prorocentrum_lima.AAC.1
MEDQGGAITRNPSAATSGSEDLRTFRAHSQPPDLSTPAQKAARFSSPATPGDRPIPQALAK